MTERGYDFKYLEELKNQCAGDQRNHAYTESEKLIFENYSRFLMLYLEGKHFSNKADIGMMAEKISAFEKESAPSFQDSQCHIEFRDIWLLVKRLDSAFLPNKRPSIVQLMEALGDQRNAVRGSVTKNEHEVKIA